ncbi:ABATE domain-containing protein [Streptomyces sp. CB01881]|uniref:CGNR zinc finger domain-containing protein n=1 Tax=Streptomyces sp. CB01881 TaxID=2078691 RepID=UPI001386B568|nr:ABATE domain-containing protein [Streptomyces sp. CB01881]
MIGEVPREPPRRCGSAEGVGDVVTVEGGLVLVTAQGGPLAVEFANTIYPHRRVLQDHLRDGTAAAQWLQDRAGAFRPALAAGGAGGLDDAGLARLVGLRDAVRDALHAVVTDDQIPGPARAVINTASALSPRWPVLDCGASIEIVCGTGTDPVAEAMASIAQSAVHVLGGPLRPLVRICPAEGCPMFFVKDHPRRAWCTPACGNRNRVARHHARRQVESDPVA